MLVNNVGVLSVMTTLATAAPAPLLPLGLCSFADAEACLRGRAVLVVGTSVSRHWFFALQEILLLHAVDSEGKGLDGLAAPGSSFVGVLGPRGRSQGSNVASYRAHEMELCGGGAAAWVADHKHRGIMPFIDMACFWHHTPTNTSLRF
jgi:hypothetical protein